MSTRSVLNVLGTTDMDVKSGLSQLQGGAKSISMQQCRGGATPVQTRAYHLSKDQVHKLLLRKRQCHVQKLQFFKLEGDSTKPEEIDDLTPEGIYDYYARFCTCERTVATQYYPDNKDPVTDLVYKTHTFAPCPVNNVAALIARHLDTDLYPRTDVVYEYSKVIVPLMRELSKRIARDN